MISSNVDLPCDCNQLSQIKTIAGNGLFEYVEGRRHKSIHLLFGATLARRAYSLSYSYFPHVIVFKCFFRLQQILIYPPRSHFGSWIVLKIYSLDMAIFDHWCFGGKPSLCIASGLFLDYNSASL